LSAWEKFFFAEIDARQYAALRIVFGLFALYMLSENLPEVPVLLSATGLAPIGWHDFQTRWSLYYFFSTTPAATALLIFGMLCSVSMIVGFKSRLSTWLTLLAVCSVFAKNGVWYGAFAILQVMLFYIGLSACGNAWSLDAKDSTPRTAEIWPLRLMQIQVALVYFCNGYSKIHGIDWIDGSAVARVLLMLNPSLIEFLRPQSFALTRYVLMAATYVTIVWELGFPILIWNRTARLFALLIGVAVHIGIMTLMGLWVFGAIMIATYLSFLPADIFLRLADAIESAVAGDRQNQALVDNAAS
jgi:hypothetical protein